MPPPPSPLTAHQQRLREGQRRAQEIAAQEAERAVQLEAAVEANRKRLEEEKKRELAEYRRKADEQAAKAQKARDDAECVARLMRPLRLSLSRSSDSPPALCPPL